jgi:hypothetical protein
MLYRFIESVVSQHDIIRVGKIEKWPSVVIYGVSSANFYHISYILRRRLVYEWYRYKSWRTK